MKVLIIKVPETQTYHSHW